VCRPRGGSGRLAAWHLPGGPVGLPARWAAKSNVEGGSGTKEGAQGPLAREGGLNSDILFAGAAEFLPVPVCPCVGPIQSISRRCSHK